MYNPLTGGVTEAFITYTEFDTNLLRPVFICYLMVRHVTTLAVGHIQRARNFFHMCSLSFNLYKLV
jgi:hypothetical protein